MASSSEARIPKQRSPELVLPAGDLEKLQTALLFGADAVYLGVRISACGPPPAI